MSEDPGISGIVKLTKATELACGYPSVVIDRAEAHALLTERERLYEIVKEWGEHASWRCQYRLRYKKCCCGLDERLIVLGLPPLEVIDPEAEKKP